jgi:mercuric ion transport protein
MTRRHGTAAFPLKGVLSNVSATGRTGRRAGTRLAGLAAMACLACCALPALIAAGLLGGAAAGALASAMPKIAGVLAVAAAAVFGWAVYRGRRKPCTGIGDDTSRRCGDGCSCSATPAPTR